MRYPVDDFLTKWNITAGFGFGQKTDYGSHEAVDLNDNLGGNSDLGKPLYAIAKGTITSVHNHTANFGKHLHLKIEGAWGVRWAHYAHCNEIFVKEGDVVEEGQKIATVGNSGTTYAHCHFALKREPTGVDAVAKTLDDLKKWEDPIKFIEIWMQPSLVDTVPVEKEKFADLERIKIAWNNVRTLLNVQDSETIVLSELKKLIDYEDAVIQMEEKVHKATETATELEGKLKEANETIDTLIEANKKATEQAIIDKQQLDGMSDTIDGLTKDVQDLKDIAKEPLLTGWRKFIHDWTIRR